MTKVGLQKGEKDKELWGREAKVQGVQKGEGSISKELSVRNREIKDKCQIKSNLGQMYGTTASYLYRNLGLEGWLRHFQN